MTSGTPERPAGTTARGLEVDGKPLRRHGTGSCALVLRPIPWGFPQRSAADGAPRPCPTTRYTAALAGPGGAKSRRPGEPRELEGATNRLSGAAFERAARRIRRDRPPLVRQPDA